LSVFEFPIVRQLDTDLGESPDRCVPVRLSRNSI